MTTEVTEITTSKQKAIAKYELTPAAVAEMAKEYMTIAVPAGNNKAYAVARAALTTCVKARTGTDKRRKSLTADAREYISAVGDAAKELIAPLAPAEAHLKAELKKEDDRKAAIKAEKAAAEKARVDGINESITAIRMIATGISTMTAAQLYTLKSDVEAMECPGDEYHEFAPHAEQAKRESMAAIQTALDARIKQDAEDAARKAEGERLAGIREQQEAEAARLEKVQEEQDATRKAEDDRLAEERRKIEAEKTRVAAMLETKRKAEQEYLAAERQKLVDEKTRMAAEQERRDREERDQLDRIEADEKAKRDAELRAKEIEEAHGMALVENARIDLECKEASEAARILHEAKRPDAEKIIEFADELLALGRPAVTSPEAEATLNNVVSKIAMIAEDLKAQTKTWCRLAGEAKY